jgi:hypothetical protein
LSINATSKQIIGDGAAEPVALGLPAVSMTPPDHMHETVKYVRVDHRTLARL